MQFGATVPAGGINAAASTVTTTSVGFIAIYTLIAMFARYKLAVDVGGGQGPARVNGLTGCSGGALMTLRTDPDGQPVIPHSASPVKPVPTHSSNT